MKAMILAAGRGSRLRPLTDTLPKPLVKVADKCLIEYHLENLAQAGIREVIINTAWLADKIHQKLGTGDKYQLTIRYSDEVTALESAGGIINALPLLGDAPFLVINADIWTDYNFSTLANFKLSSQAHLIMVDNPAHNPTGDFSIENGCLSNKNIKKYTYSGIGIFQAEFFNTACQTHQPQTPLALAPLLREKANKNKISAQLYQGKWIDVGTSRRLNELTHYLKQPPK